MNSMQELAKKMMSAIQELIKDSETVNSKSIDSHLESLSKIQTQKLPLKSPLLNNYFFALIHTLSTSRHRNHLDESQVEKILDIILKLFIMKGMYDMSIINSNQDASSLAAVLIQYALNLVKVSANKEIVNKSLVILGEVWKVYNLKMQVYPSICSTMFKILNNEFDSLAKSSKPKQIALSILNTSFGDLFKNRMTKLNQSKSHSGIKELIINLKKKKPTNEPGKNSSSQNDLENIAITKVSEFFQIFNSNIEKASQNANIHLIRELATFCLESIQVNAFDIQTIQHVVEIFFFVLEKQEGEELSTDEKQTENDNKQPIILSIKDIIKALKENYNSSQISFLMDGMKGEMLNKIRRLPRLVNEIADGKYLKILKGLSSYFELSKLTETDSFLPEEKALICDNIAKAFQFQFNLKIRLVDNPMSVVPLNSLKVESLIIEKDLEDQISTFENIKQHLILQSLPLANYKLEVLKSSNHLLYELNDELAMFLLDHYYSSLISIDYQEHLIQGAISTPLLANLCSYHYTIQQIILTQFSQDTVNCKKIKLKKGSAFLGGMQFHLIKPKDNIQMYFIDVVRRYYDHLMLLDFYENFEIKSEDVETLQLLEIENAFYCFQLINQDFINEQSQQIQEGTGEENVNSSSYQNLLKLITFLLKKHSIENYSIRLLTEILIQTLSLKDKATVQTFLQQHASSLVQRSLVQIRQLDMLQDKEGPFKVMDELFVKFKGFHYLTNEVENVISTLNRCYDRYYLKAHSSFVRLYLDFFFSFINYWNDHTIVQQMTLEEIEAEKQEYKKYSDDSNPKLYENAEPERDNMKNKKQKNQFTPFFQEKDEEDRKIRMGNVMRHLLLRVKTLAVSRNKALSVLTLQILLNSLKILYKLKQNREEGNINFSTNDPENVQIPDSLGPLLHEYELSFQFILKDNALAESTYLASGIQVLSIYIKLLEFTEANYSFLMVKNVRQQLSPLLLNILKTFSKDLKNSLRGKVAKRIVQFLSDYMTKKPNEKFLRENDNVDDDKIVDALKNFKQELILFLKQHEKSHDISKIHTDLAREMFNQLDEFV